MDNWKGDAGKGTFRIDAEQLHRISEATITHYDRLAEAYSNGTRDHDVSQNYTALLDAIEGDPPYCILDLGCGPGRDLHHFRSLGHDAVGLDGSKEFVAMARTCSGCDVLHQDFLAMELPKSRFDGVFANASLFHVPSQELPRVLLELSETLRPRGVLFCSNPRGNNEEGFSDGRPAPQRKTVSHNLLQSKSEKARRYSRATVRLATVHICAIRSGRSICGTFRATPTHVLSIP
jgi:SAM-dependent methyltransferase